MFLQSHWVMSGLTPLMYVLCPIFFLWFDWNIFPNARPLEVFCTPLALSIITTAMLWLAQRHYIPVLWHGRQLFMALSSCHRRWQHSKPFGKPLLPINPVTPKGQAAMGRHIDGRTLACLVVVLLGMITGLVRAGWRRTVGTRWKWRCCWSGACTYEHYHHRGPDVLRAVVSAPRRAVRSGCGAGVTLGAWPGDSRADSEHVRDGSTGTHAASIVLPVDQPLYLQKRHVPAPLPCTLVYRSDTELAVDFPAHQPGGAQAPCEPSTPTLWSRATNRQPSPAGRGETVSADS